MILVTGATGKVGRQAVAQLHWVGTEVRALVRDPARAAGLPDGVQVVRGDLTDPGTLGPAFAGVDAVFLVWPLMTADTAPAVVDIAATHARRIVYLSAWGVPDDADAQSDGILGFHAAIEGLIRKSGLEWTFLRPGGFASNTLGWADQIRSGDVVHAPYANAARSLIHEADIAAVGVRALTHDGHAGAVYHLTGPEVLTQAAQVRTIGEVLGREVRFEEKPPGTARAEYLAAGFPPEVADGILEAHARMAVEPEPVTPTVAEVTGRPARTFRAWARDHAADFRG